LGDLNKDGLLDAVFASSSLSVGVLYGGAGGSFGNYAGYGVSSGPNTLVLADLSGDGVLDIMTSNHAVIWGNTLCGGP